MNSEAKASIQIKAYMLKSSFKFVFLVEAACLLYF